MIEALQRFGFGALGKGTEDPITPGRIIQLGVKPNRVDILTSISGVSFEEAWKSRVEGSLDGIPAQFIGLTELILNKQSTGRAKDPGDAEELQKRQLEN
jgi:hypothetical protein